MLLSFIQHYPFIPAFLLGLIPALIWLWFWLKEDSHPEPAKMITLSFLGGMASVVFVLPVQHFIYNYFTAQIDAGQINLPFTLFAATEEIFKFTLAYVIALRNKATDEPADDIIYLIISALGFVAMENTLFLISPLKVGNILETIANGNLRFIGASLLHVISSSSIGVLLALSFYKNRKKKGLYLFWGIIIAISLHTSFNLLIINGDSGNLLFIFGLVWLGAIALLLLFEKIKTIKPTTSS